MQELGWMGGRAASKGEGGGRGQKGLQTRKGRARREGLEVGGFTTES